MRRFCEGLIIFWVAVSSVFAHEYWLEPEIFFLKPGERSTVRLFAGEALKKEEERPYQSSKTPLFKLFSATDSFDLAGFAHEDEAPLFKFSSEKEGTFLIALERNWSYITLEPKQFDDYLREEGMEYIITEREKRGESAREGKERYSRYLKSLLQVGIKRDKTFARLVGSVLEIVPLENPYAKKSGTLSVQVFFGGKPLADKIIFADNRDGENISKQELKTDANGKAAVKLDRKGVWLIRTVHMRRCIKACEGADWESFWGALTFGVK
jgi:uncharacterized GH25 family protein